MTFVPQSYLIISNGTEVFSNLSMGPAHDRQSLEKTLGTCIEVLARVEQGPNEIELELTHRVDRLIDIYAQSRGLNAVRLLHASVYERAGLR